MKTEKEKGKIWEARRGSSSKFQACDWIDTFGKISNNVETTRVHIQDFED